MYLQAPTARGAAVQEGLIEAEELRSPVHDNDFELGACRTADPLWVSQYGRLRTLRMEVRTLNPGLDTADE